MENGVNTKDPAHQTMSSYMVYGYRSSQQLAGKIQPDYGTRISKTSFFVFQGRQREMFADCVRPILDDPGLLFVCFLCSQGFIKEEDYLIHAIIHFRGTVSVHSSCLMATFSREKHDCQVPQQQHPDKSQYQYHRSFKHFSQFPISDVPQQHILYVAHLWADVVFSVRYSNDSFSD